MPNPSNLSCVRVPQTTSPYPEFSRIDSNISLIDQTPPRRELKVSDPAVRDKTLFQLQLAPSSVLMLSFFEESLNRMSFYKHSTRIMLIRFAAVDCVPVCRRPRSGTLRPVHSRRG